MYRRPPRRAVLVAVLLLSRIAKAAGDEPSLFQQHPTTVYAQLGLGTPLGWAGAEVEQTVTSFLALSGGVGMGFAGPQVAFMPRLRLGNRASAGTFGMGLSYGKYRREDTCLFDCSPAVFEGKVAWANFEGGVEHQWDGGLSLRAFVGFGHIVAGDLACTGGDLCGWDHDDARKVFYLGSALGWSF